jgi:hypothetical protein
MNTYNDQVMSQSQVSTAKDEQTFSITLTAEQRKLLMYSAGGLSIYFLLKSLIDAAVRKVRKEE